MMFDLMVTSTDLCMTQDVLTVHFVKLRHISAAPYVKGDYAQLKIETVSKDFHTQK